MKTLTLGLKFASFLLVLLLILSTGSHGERVDMPAAWLKETATNVITGTVTAVYEAKIEDNEWSTTRCVAEVRIKTVEKGEGPKTGDLVYVRYWHRRWISKKPPQPDTNGHRGLPTSGQTLRIYLTRNAYNGAGNTNDGGFDVVFANGFEKIDK